MGRPDPPPTSGRSPPPRSRRSWGPRIDPLALDPPPAATLRGPQKEVASWEAPLSKKTEKGVPPPGENGLSPSARARWRARRAALRATYSPPAATQQVEKEEVASRKVLPGPH